MTEVFCIKDFNFWRTGKESDACDCDALRTQLAQCREERRDLEVQVRTLKEIFVKKEEPAPVNPPRPVSGKRQGKP